MYKHSLNSKSIFLWRNITDSKYLTPLLQQSILGNLTMIEREGLLFRSRKWLKLISNSFSRIMKCKRRRLLRRSNGSVITSCSFRGWRSRRCRFIWIWNQSSCSSCYRRSQRGITGGCGYLGKTRCTSYYFRLHRNSTGTSGTENRRNVFPRSRFDIGQGVDSWVQTGKVVAVDMGNMRRLYYAWKKHHLLKI